MSFTTFEAYSQAVDLVGRYRSVTKTITGVRTNAMFSLWNRPGIPTAGVFPTAGLGSAAALDRTTVGAIETINAPAGQVNYLCRLRADAISATTVQRNFLLIDRLAHAAVTISQATGAFSPVIDGTARLNSGEGAFIGIEVSVALGTGTNTFSLTYTNEAGSTGRVTPNITSVASAAVSSAAYANTVVVPLQAGDIGARTITNWTLVSGTQTGTVCIFLFKPLAWIGQTMLIMPSENEFGISRPFMPIIPSDACLNFLMTSNSATAGQFQGGLTVVSG